MSKDGVVHRLRKWDDNAERIACAETTTTARQGGVTEDWKDSVNAQLVQLDGDIRALLYGLIGGFLFLLAAGGYAYMKLADLQTAAQVQQARIDAKLDTLVERTATAKP